MIQFIIRRLLLAIPVLLGILFITFALARLLPGDPCRAALGEHATDAICNAYAERFGLNKPIPEQFIIYLSDVLRGDLGESFRLGQPVTEILVDRLPITVELAFSSLIFASIFGIIFGTISAYWRNSPIDVITMLGANIGVSIPVFVLGLVLAYFFAISLKDTPLALPPSGRLSPGTPVPSLAEVWRLEHLEGLPRGILDFMSNVHLFSAMVTFNWALLVDSIKH
ncbi:MAG: ABC transporter permease, partial [Anaerolineae bacterium]